LERARRVAIDPRKTKGDALCSIYLGRRVNARGRDPHLVAALQESNGKLHM